MTLTINGTTYAAQEFAWDGCHKIYLITTPEDRATMLEYGYDEPGDILPVSDLPEVWENLCSLRFISPADLSDDIVPQFYEEDNGPVQIEYTADEDTTADEDIPALLERLRAAGCAVVAFEPIELDGLDPKRVENVLVDEASELIESMQAQQKQEADK